MKGERLMKQYRVEQLTKTVGEKTLFQDVEFLIQTGEKVGLIGINGTGKSTFLSILAKEEVADSVFYDHPNDFRIAYLPQVPEMDEESTVLDIVFSSESPLMELNRAYEHVMHQLTSDPMNEEVQERFTELQQRMDEYEAWDMNTQARTILTKLGITEHDQKIRHLSGGQQKRVALAKTLLEPADLILLDEPTNHLDVDSIEWLQQYLINSQSAVIFITHDRYFLDAVSTSIYEIADQTLYTHQGNYGDYLEAKALREEQKTAHEAKQKNRYRNELKWVMRGARARSTKQKARLGRFEKLKKDVQTKEKEGDFDLSVQTTRLGKKVIELENVSKSFGQKTIVHDFSTLLQGGDRIAIIGPNGVGKTTLLRMIAGEEKQDHGLIDRGETVKIAHFHQHIPDMNTDERMISYIRDVSNAVRTGDGEVLSATQMLENFLFPSHVHGTPVYKLSGGEKKRLYLLRLLMEEPNVLLLDEPTNDLDIETLSILESFIDTFPGVVITISHDRFFLDRTTSELWALDGTGHVFVYNGLYTDYLAWMKEKEEATEKVEKIEKPKEKKQSLRFSYHEKRDLEQLPKEIEEIEEKMLIEEEAIAAANDNYEKLMEHTANYEQLEARYEQIFERLMELEEKKEKMERQEKGE